MILLKAVRLINWYGFSNVTVPIGFFTLIAGKNGNGKSVMLDAIKYAAYADTVFNKSSESKGSRTLSSYTRGLLDATAGTYMRPADKVPNVCSHIVLEFYDEEEERSFLLGTVIETKSANNCQTYRYVMDQKTLDEVAHTTQENGAVCPMTAVALQKIYKVQLLNREQAIPRFMQMTGLKLGLGQVPTYLRKLRGIMSYDPDAKIDRFIRESVLEEHNVDFTKLIDAKKNIERLRGTFQAIEGEIESLDEIIVKFDGYENEKNRLLADDICVAYKKKTELKTKIEQLSRQQELAGQQQEEVERELAILEKRSGVQAERLVQARVSLQQMDSAKMIAEENRKLSELRERAQRYAAQKDELEGFQTRVSEMLAVLIQQEQPVDKKEILASLCSASYSVAEKRNAVENLKALVNAAYEEQLQKLFRIQAKTEEVERRLEEQEQILDACKKHRNAFRQIPDYVGLRDEINRVFKERGIRSEAKFACEYVIGLKDETWRDALEAFLGARRYTVLVDPQYYDVADEVFNRSKYHYAHLFNTKLLMKKDIEVQKDSVVHTLDIKNKVAQTYFDYQLGRMHAAELSRVKEYENAISREGRVSVAMDSYFLRFDKIRFYYLGQKTFELNQKRAEREIAQLQKSRRELMEQQKEAETVKCGFMRDKSAFREYVYDAPQSYQDTMESCRASEQQLKKLQQAQKNNSEFMELSQLVTLLSAEQEALREKQKAKNKELAKLTTDISVWAEMQKEKETEKTRAENDFREYEITAFTLVQKAVEAYQRYLENGSTGNGGPLQESSRNRLRQRMEQTKNELIQLQTAYNGRNPEKMLSVGLQGRKEYAARRERIWMDDMQEVRDSLEAQTRRYEDIFKNEFVLTILKACERAREDLRQINRELAKLQFSAKYEFDVHYVRDGSDYARILQYAEYLDEREKLGDSGVEGQMSFGIGMKISDEEGAQLEQELRQIISRIISHNSEETIARFADYRNYMTYEILISNGILHRAKLSRQTGFNSGAEVQIPYLLILSAALLLIYNQRVSSTRLVFIDEPFAKMDPGNVKIMLDFMREQDLQVIFCSPDKTESIGNECEVILPVLRVRADNMQIGIVQFHGEKRHG